MFAEPVLRRIPARFLTPFHLVVAGPGALRGMDADAVTLRLRESGLAMLAVVDGLGPGEAAPWTGRPGVRLVRRAEIPDAIEPRAPLGDWARVTLDEVGTPADMWMSRAVLVRCALERVVPRRLEVFRVLMGWSGEYAHDLVARITGHPPSEVLERLVVLSDLLARHDGVPEGVRRAVSGLRNVATLRAKVRRVAAARPDWLCDALAARGLDLAPGAAVPTCGPACSPRRAGGCGGP